MLNLFKNFVKSEFQHIIDNNEEKINSSSNNMSSNSPKEIIDKSDYIEDLVTFYLSYRKIISDCFGSHNLFNVTYNEALENIQADNPKFNNSYILPFYLDKYLKRSSVNSNSQAYQVIDNVINIFPTLPDKDVFVDMHRNLVYF